MHIVIVGSGPGGLCSAINLAGMGLKVTVLDKDLVPGGRMKGLSFGDHGEYSVDTGPTILQLPELLASVFLRAGRRIEDYARLMPLDPSTRLHMWDGSVLDTSRDPERMAASLRQFGADKPEAFERWWKESCDKYALAYEKFIATPADSLEYYSPLRLLPTLKYRPWRTLYNDLFAYFRDPRIVYALSYPSKYLGLHPTTCSSVFSVIPFIEMAFGVWHVENGFRALAAGMKRCAEDLGASFRMGESVAQVLIEDGHTTGVVLTSGERIKADCVVVNADLAWAAENLIDARWRRWTRISDTALSRAQFSCSTFMMYLGLDRTYDQLPHHLIHLSESVLRTDRDALEDRVIDLSNPPFYVCNPCVTDASGAPAGHSTLYVLVPVPNTRHAVDWDHAKSVLSRRVPEMLAKVGMHDVGRHVRASKIFTAETWRDDFNVAHGAVFNLSHTWTQLGPARPRVRMPGVDGLFFVGGGTHPGSGLLTIVESANIAADYISRAAGRGALTGWPFVPPVGAVRSEFRSVFTEEALGIRTGRLGFEQDSAQ